MARGIRVVDLPSREVFGRYDLRVKRIIDHLGVSPDVFCGEAGLCRTLAYGWLAARWAPSARSIVRLCNYWGLSADWMLGLLSNSLEEAFLQRGGKRQRMA